MIAPAVFYLAGSLFGLKKYIKNPRFVTGGLGLELVAKGNAYHVAFPVCVLHGQVLQLFGVAA